MFGLKKIPDGASQNFSDIKQQIHMQRRTQLSQAEQRKTEKVKIWPNLAKSLKLFRQQTARTTARSQSKRRRQCNLGFE